MNSKLKHQTFHQFSYCKEPQGNCKLIFSTNSLQKALLKFATFLQVGFSGNITNFAERYSFHSSGKRQQCSVCNLMQFEKIFPIHLDKSVFISVNCYFKYTFSNTLLNNTFLLTHLFSNVPFLYSLETLGSLISSRGHRIVISGTLFPS